jgi:ribosome silencing factor RsfS/YbeB/iojap
MRRNASGPHILCARQSAARPDTRPLKTTLDSERQRSSSSGATLKATSKAAPRKTAKPAAKKTAAGAAKRSGSSPGKSAASKAGGVRKSGVKPAAKKGAAKTKTKTAVAKKPVAAKPASRRAAPVDTGPKELAPVVATLRRSVLSALEEMKAKEVKEIDIRGKASFADLLVIASGTSTRHVKSLADEVVKFVKKAGMMPLGIEGQKEAEWVLVDLGDIVCHIMLPRIREFYALERLWSVGGDLEASND